MSDKERPQEVNVFVCPVEEGGMTVEARCGTCKEKANLEVKLRLVYESPDKTERLYECPMCKEVSSFSLASFD